MFSLENQKTGEKLRKSWATMFENLRKITEILSHNVWKFEERLGKNIFQQLGKIWKNILKNQWNTLEKHVQLGEKIRSGKLIEG